MDNCKLILFIFYFLFLLVPVFSLLFCPRLRGDESDHTSGPVSGERGGLSLVSTDHVTSTLASDWWRERPGLEIWRIQHLGRGSRSAKIGSDEVDVWIRDG